MKQKVRFEKDLKAGTITVIESSEVDPGVNMPLVEEQYDLAEMVQASKNGADEFIRLLRRRSFFPTIDMSQKLYESTIDFFKDNDQEKVVVDYDDADAFPTEEEFQLEDDVELDKILEEDGDSKEDEIKEIDSGDDNIKFTPEDISEHEN